MKVLFYGRLGDVIGREVELDLPGRGLTVGALRRVLAERYPAAADDLTGRNMRACIDDRIVGEETSIDEGSAVEFFPPLSGG